MRILIADDSLLSRRILEETLRNWSYEVISAVDGAEAWNILNSPDAPSIAILDWMMPGYTGPDLCRLVRKKATEPYTYILLLTSKTEKGDVVFGLDAGADDYLTKPFDRHELQVRLRAGTRIVELQEQLMRTREALRVQATRDYLTQIWNRSAILEVLDRELARSRREGHSVGVVLADVDNFKSINDTWGHGAGDKALKETASGMQAALRQYDSVGRYGGEEFLIVLPGANLSDSAWLADRVRMAIRSKRLAVGDTTIQLTCSFGCASGIGNVHEDELIRYADEALYSAKRAGRDRVVAVRSEESELPAAATIRTSIATSVRPEIDLG